MLQAVFPENAHSLPLLHTETEQAIGQLVSQLVDLAVAGVMASLGQAGIVGKVTGLVFSKLVDEHGGGSCCCSGNAFAKGPTVCDLRGD